MTMTEWRAIVAWPRPADTTAEQLAEIGQALPGFGIITADEHRVRAEMTVEGATLRQATDAALRAARDAAVGPVRLGQPTQLRVLPVDDYTAEVSRPPAQDLIGYAEAAEILGVSRQRVGQLAEHPDFPPPVATPAMGPILSRASILEFAKLPRKGGRPPKTGA